MADAQKDIAYRYNWAIAQLRRQRDRLVGDELRVESNEASDQDLFTSPDVIEEDLEELSLKLLEIAQELLGEARYWRTKAAERNRRAQDAEPYGRYYHSDRYDRYTTRHYRYSSCSSSDSDIPSHLIHVLPPEILGLIFSLACYHDPNSRHRGLSHSSDHIIDQDTRQSIRATCQLWRGIAESTQSIWTELSIELSRHRGGCSKPSLPVIMTQVKRAGAHRQFDLFLVEEEYSSMQECAGDCMKQTVYVSILKAIRNLFPRCRTIQLLMLHNVQMVFGNQNLGSLPHLQTLIIKRDYHSRINYGHDSLRSLDLSASPSLGHLWVEGFTVENLLVPPHNAIRKICLPAGLSCAKVLQVLRQSQELNQLTWCTSRSDTNMEDILELLGQPLEQVELPRLKQLKTSSTRALDLIRAPQLHRLESTAELRGFRTPNKFPSVRILDMSSSDFAETNAGSVRSLSHFPGVEVVIFSSWSRIGPSFCSALLERDNTGANFILLPSMKYLQAEFRDDVDPGMLVQERRRRSTGEDVVFELSIGDLKPYYRRGSLANYDRPRFRGDDPFTSNCFDFEL